MKPSNRLWHAIALVLLLLLGGAWAAHAQTTPTSPAAPPADGRVEFQLGQAVYELDPTAAVNACIVAHDETLDTEIVTLRLFGRVAGSEQFEPEGLFPTPMTPDLDGHPVGFCVALRGES
jgi:hypothetical protein